LIRGAIAQSQMKVCDCYKAHNKGDRFPAKKLRLRFGAVAEPIALWAAPEEHRHAHSLSYIKVPRKAVLYRKKKTGKMPVL